MNGDIGLELHKGTDDSCGAIWTALSTYADAEANDNQRMLVEAHVHDCALCAGELEVILQSSKFLSGVAELSPPDYLRERILAATVNRQSLAARWLAIALSGVRFSPARYGTVALAGVVAAILVSVNRSGPMVPDKKVLLPEAHTQVLAQTPKTESQSPTRQLDSANSPVQPRTSPVSIGKHYSNQARIELAKAIYSPRGARIAGTVTTVRNAAAAPAPTPKRLFASSSLPFKAKPGVSQAAPEVVAPDVPNSVEPVMAPAAAGMVSADMKTPVTTEAIEETPVKSPTVCRIQLSASGPEIPGGQTATLAGLKQALKQQSMRWNVNELRQSMRDKQIRIDLIKRSF